MSWRLETPTTELCVEQVVVAENINDPLNLCEGNPPVNGGCSQKRSGMWKGCPCHRIVISHGMSTPYRLLSWFYNIIPLRPKQNGAILPTMFSNTFARRKSLCFDCSFTDMCSKCESIIWTDAGVLLCRIYAPSSLDGLTIKDLVVGVEIIFTY